LRRRDGEKLWRTWRLTGSGGARLDKLYSLLNVLHEAERFTRIGYKKPWPLSVGGAGARPVRRRRQLWARHAGLPCAGYEPAEVKAPSPMAAATW
jgi:hypothetical protein